MKKRLLFFLLVLGLSPSLYADPAGKTRSFHFAVMNPPALGSDIPLQTETDRTHPQQIAFVVVNGVRAKNEPCTDSLYLEQKKRFEESGAPLFLSPVGSDWIGCKSEDGEDIRIERLQRLREIFFEQDTSFGITDIPLFRQSLVARYRHFPENTSWRHGAVLFATLHLPADNNHYLDAAGRNNEFEERLVANRHWLQRIFTLAKRDKLAGIVIFCDGNPFENQASRKTASRDGFREIRQQMTKLAGNFPGKILIIHRATEQKKPAIAWKNNLGLAAAGATWLEIGVNPDSRSLFSIEKFPAAKKQKRAENDT